MCTHHFFQHSFFTNASVNGFFRLKKNQAGNRSSGPPTAQSIPKRLVNNTVLVFLQVVPDGFVPRTAMSGQGCPGYMFTHQRHADKALVFLQGVIDE